MPSSSPPPTSHLLLLLLISSNAFIQPALAVQQSREDSSKPDKNQPRIKVFGRKDYEALRNRYMDDGDSGCVETKQFQPRFNVCTHNPSTDPFISEFILSYGKPFEWEVSSFLDKVLSVYGREAVFVDVGANIGSKSLHMASLGNRVFAVEPLNINLVRIYHAARMNSIDESRLTLLKASVDREHTRHFLQPAVENLAATMVQYGDYSSRVEEGSPFQMEVIESSKLSDVIRHVVKETQKSEDDVVDLIVHLDCQLMECKALLGSPGIFSMPGVNIPYIVVKWFMVERLPDDSLRYHTHCPLEMVKATTELLVSNGYSPYLDMKMKAWEAVDPAGSEEWEQINVMWMHKDAKPVLQKVVNLFEA